MATTRQEHWAQVYTTKPTNTVSWYQPTPEPSLRALSNLQVPVTASLIDIGGGTSSLVDNLLGRGQSDLTDVHFTDSSIVRGHVRYPVQG